jgi:hypothetical protein
MKFLITLLVVVTSFQLKAQIVAADSLVGTWVCTEVKQLAIDKEFDNPKGKEIMDITKKAYLGSTFTFGADGIFRQTVTKTSQDFSEMLSFINGQKWHFNALGKSITIGPPRENIMSIDVVEAEGATYFVIKDIPLWLKMARKPKP